MFFVVYSLTMEGYFDSLALYYEGTLSLEMDVALYFSTVKPMFYPKIGWKSILNKRKMGY